MTSLVSKIRNQERTGKQVCSLFLLSSNSFPFYFYHSYPFIQLTNLFYDLGVSSPPGCPTIELSSRTTKTQEDDTGVTDEVNIIWTVPDDDGGYPITGINFRRSTMKINYNNISIYYFHKNFLPLIECFYDFE